METIGMATEDAASGGLEFLADPVDRFPLPDLGSGEAVLDAATTQTLVCAAAQSSVAGVGNATTTVQLDGDASCEGVSLSAPSSEQSAGKDESQASGWAKRVRIGRAPLERPPCAGRISALEKSLRCYAEKKRETVVVRAVGDSFDSLEEAHGYYNLYSWEIGFGQSLENHARSQPPHLVHLLEKEEITTPFRV
ncbi:hypothetical protein ACQJBY_068339 [Aegilops geniculata]